MIPALSSHPESPYQSFESQAIFTEQKIMVAALAAIASLSLMAAFLPVHSIEGVFVVFAVGGTALMLTLVVLSLGQAYPELAYTRSEPLMFRQRWFPVFPRVQYFPRSPFFVRNPVYPVLTPPILSPSPISGQRVRVGGGQVHGAHFSPPSFRPNGNLGGDRVRVGSRRP